MKRHFFNRLPLLLILLAGLLFPVCVHAAYAPQSISLNPSGLNMVSDTDLPLLFSSPTGEEVLYFLVGQEQELRARVEPSSSSSAFYLVSSDETVLQVNGNKVRAVGRGVCKLTLISAGNEEVTCTITAAAGRSVQSISIVKGRELFDIGASYTMSAEVVPSDADYQKLRWQSTDESLFTVDEQGVVTTLKRGYTLMYVYAMDGSQVRESCHLRIVSYPREISISGKASILGVGRGLSLEAEMEPYDAHTCQVTWSSSAPEIASVDESGKVTGISPGEAVIKAESTLVEGLSAEYPITVVQPAESIYCSVSAITLNIGETWMPPFTVTPENTSQQDLAKSLSREGVVELNEDGSVTALKKGSVKLKLYSVYGRASEEIAITVIDCGYEELDEEIPGTETFTFGTSVLGRRLLCTRIGEETASNRILITFCMHGFEDEFSRDGLLLVRIGQKLIRSLAGQVPEDWAVYIVPCMNPDGAIGGRTNDGYGRCNAEGYDINRDFPVKWEKSRLNRNRTGSEPFTTPEARALRDLALNLQPGLCVDVHGYISLINGSESPQANCFAESFGLRVRPGYDGGTFYQWAEQEFGTAFLLELTKPTDDKDAYVEEMTQKMENALLRIMAEVN